MNRRLSWNIVAGAAVVALVGACSSRDPETRAREAAEQILASIPDVVSRALDQKVQPDEVRAVQAQLTRINEYQGEINGELDAVTVNAVMAFQNARGLKANGFLTDETKRQLQEAAAKNG